MSDIDEILKHAQLANFDNEVSSMVILMIAKGEPEAHITISTKDVFAMNASVDMFKMEMYKLMAASVENKGKRE